MTYVRAFIAGIVLPTVLLPIILYMSTTFFPGKLDFLTIHFIHWIPIIWGIWNVLYYAFFRTAVAWNSGVKLFVWGAILGLLLACYAVFIVHVPELLVIKSDYQYLPLLIAPLLYGILWMWIVQPLNRVVGLMD